MTKDKSTEVETLEVVVSKIVELVRKETEKKKSKNMIQKVQGLLNELQKEDDVMNQTKTTFGASDKKNNLTFNLKNDRNSKTENQNNKNDLSKVKSVKMNRQKITSTKSKNLPNPLQNLRDAVVKIPTKLKSVTKKNAPSGNKNTLTVLNNTANINNTTAKPKSLDTEIRKPRAIKQIDATSKKQLLKRKTLSSNRVILVQCHNCKSMLRLKRIPLKKKIQPSKLE